MNPIVQLKNEHEAVRTALAVFDKLASLLVRSSEDGRVTDDICRLVEFLQVFVDRCHHAKEEKMLFPVMEEVGITREGGPLGVMLAEHRQGREAIEGMVEALTGVRRREPAAVARFAEYAHAYAQLLYRHIEKENTVLFAFAERHLTTLQLHRLEAEFEHLEQEEIGTGKHEAFHRMLDELAGRYLGKRHSDPGCACRG